jgi:RimJ/RimL family protein N-acetyltransferase
MFAHSPCRRIVGATPANNRLALRFAIACGMEHFGTNPKAFLKNGVLHDLILTGISA